MVPFRRLALFAETALVVVGKHRLAIRSRNLAPEDRGGLRIVKGVYQWAQPAGILRSGVGIEKDRQIAAGELHAEIEDAARSVLVRENLDQVARIRVAQQFDRAVGRS